MDVLQQAIDDAIRAKGMFQVHMQNIIGGLPPTVIGYGRPTDRTPRPPATTTRDSGFQDDGDTSPTTTVVVQTPETSRSCPVMCSVLAWSVYPVVHVLACLFQPSTK